MLLLLTATRGFGQKYGRDGTTVRDVTFMVRNGDYIKNIAAHINVPAHQIVKRNHLKSKNFLAYPGFKLILPVKVQPKVWDPTKEEINGNTPSREDRHDSEDFELVIDSSNYRLAEDFINLNEAQSDSFEYANIETHVQKLDKRINYLFYKIDSFKKAEFKFDYDENDNNSILGKMKAARDKFYFEGPLGKKIDSMNAVKKMLGMRRVVLRNQATEFEYLSENAAYSERNFKKDEKEKPSDWGAHLSVESGYKKEKPKPVFSNTSLIPKVDYSTNSDDNIERPLSLQADTQPVKPAITQAYVEPTTEPSKTENITAPAKKVVEPAAITKKEIIVPKPESDYVNLADTTAEDEPEVHHYKTDFALLGKQKFTEELQLHFQPKLHLISDIKIPSHIVPAPPKENNTKTENTAQPSAPQKTNDAIAHPTKVIENTASEQTNGKTPTDSVNRIKGEFFLIRAKQALAKNDSATAEAHLKKSIELNPNNTEVRMQYGDLLLSQGRPQLAIKEYDKVLELNPRNASALYQRGIAKILSNSLLQGCLDLSAAQELGNKDAEKAIKKYCE
jgi:tetratricopeptide (TPR) repeat protein